jgi:hypothetical protein
VSAKPRLFIHVGGARHFLQWERRIYAWHFELVDAPGADVAVHGYGPDVIESTAALPARHRSIMVFPGFASMSPFFDEEYRAGSAELLRQFDLVFANPGPVAAAYADLPNLRLVDFSVDVSRFSHPRYRTRLDSLLHASADFPQKDWRRSDEVMRRTGLEYEVFPPRTEGGVARNLRRRTLLRRKLNTWSQRMGLPFRFSTPNIRYVDHTVLMKKYLHYDGFVHVAAPTPPRVDGLYTATLMEAGLTGALLFWHDTHGLGGFLESVFELPVDPQAAADRILDIRASVDPYEQSRRTRDELAERFAPERSVTRRCELILEQLESRAR